MTANLYYTSTVQDRFLVLTIIRQTFCRFQSQTDDNKQSDDVTGKPTCCLSSLSPLDCLSPNIFLVFWLSNIVTMGVPDEGYYRNLSYIPNQISVHHLYRNINNINSIFLLWVTYFKYIDLFLIYKITNLYNLNISTVCI